MADFFREREGQKSPIMQRPVDNLSRGELTVTKSDRQRAQELVPLFTLLVGFFLNRIQISQEAFNAGMMENPAGLTGPGIEAAEWRHVSLGLAGHPPGPNHRQKCRHQVAAVLANQIGWRIPPALPAQVLKLPNGGTSPLGWPATHQARTIVKIAATRSPRFSRIRSDGESRRPYRPRY